MQKKSHIISSLSLQEPKNKPLVYSAQDVKEIFQRFSSNTPEPKTELYFINPFTLLVAVVLSAQTTDAAVNKTTQKLFHVADSPARMILLSEQDIGAYIRTLGLWRNKAKNILALSKILLRDFNGEVPSDLIDLQKLPGVGRKTANVILNTVFGLPVIAVDTHIFRIANRLRLAEGKTPEAVEKALMGVIPSQYQLHAHHWLILHGRYVCKALKPKCEICIIADLCKAPKKLPNFQPFRTI